MSLVPIKALTHHHEIDVHEMADEDWEDEDSKDVTEIRRSNQLSGSR